VLNAEGLEFVLAPFWVRFLTPKRGPTLFRIDALSDDSRRGEAVNGEETWSDDTSMIFLFGEHRSLTRLGGSEASPGLGGDRRGATSELELESS
jgi:hypothetical protein